MKKTLFLLMLPSCLLAAPVMQLVPIISSGLTQSVGLTHAGDNSHRIFINEKAGQIRIYNQQTKSLLPTVFLDISARLTTGSTNSERGLLGVAFHPDYSNNGFFYVHYSSNGTTCGASNGDTVISRFSVSADPNIADSTSEQCIFTTAQPFSNHNGGQISFGPDGYLYIGLGDGGSANDPGNRGQDKTQFLGKILRIDINSGTNYSIPPDNPFVGDPNALDEIWAWGLRNPWRFSFDRETGDLFIADVGQNTWEEIDFQPASSTGGENYGWVCREGAHDFLNTRPNCPANNPVDPIIEYNHNFGCSITGGSRYRGSLFPALTGYYLYGDFCDGTIWAATDASGSWTSEVVIQGGFGLTTFGEDENGEIYAIYGSVISRVETIEDVFKDGFEEQ